MDTNIISSDDAMGAWPLRTDDMHKEKISMAPAPLNTQHPTPNTQHPPPAPPLPSRPFGYDQEK
eukprot:11198642-Prorocentrum_lima.AAC.1